MSRSLWHFCSFTLSLVDIRQGPNALAAAWSHRYPIAFIASTTQRRLPRHPATSLLCSISLLSMAPAARIHHYRFGSSVGRSALFRNSNNHNDGDGDGDGGEDDNSQKKEKLIGPAIQPRRPNENTYWVIPNKFLAGEYPGDRSGTKEATRQKLRAYLNLGVTCFFDLTVAEETHEYESILKELEQERAAVNNSSNSNKTVEYHRYPIPDFGIPSNPILMKHLLREMDRAMYERNRTVYVHCRGGIGRTGTTVGCFLKQYGNYVDGEEALQELNRLFQTSRKSLESSYSPETPDQIRFVKEWNSKR